MANVFVRDELRTDVINALISAFPGAQKVSGGVAFMSEVLDEDTGKFFPVEIKVAIKNTADTEHAAAYDLQAAVAEYAAKPGRRVADPAKTAANAAAKAQSAARKEANLATLRAWVNANPVSGMSATEIHKQIPEFADMLPMSLGGLLKTLVEEQMLTVEIEKGTRKKLYSK